MGAGNYIRNVMTKALGEDKSQSVLSRIAQSTSARPIEILDWMDARSIAELISDEHHQIVALVVSYLDAGLGADVIGLLPENMQAEVIRRISDASSSQISIIKMADFCVPVRPSKVDSPSGPLFSSAAAILITSHF